ncbi:hypothetical protein DEO72_LG3g1925 [Vigna unguiculata]|uniref:Uncharacterized protein n=1 Tax=Vigna unguiculata TaxID=3917 RepID=A0A4D6LFK5_VIGUN|nr:hypothetical protein DEO72_LG3g1925 [Vigna unguiculata]
MCYKCYNETISSHTRVLGCNPYLESLPSYIDGAPPWTPTNRGHGITSRQLKHDLETPPRDFKELRTDHGPIIIKQVNPIPTPHTPSMNIEF